MSTCKQIECLVFFEDKDKITLKIFLQIDYITTNGFAENPVFCFEIR